MQCLAQATAGHENRGSNNDDDDAIDYGNDEYNDRDNEIGNGDDEDGNGDNC